MPLGPRIDQSSIPPMKDIGRALEVVIADGKDDPLREEVARFVTAAHELRQPPEEVLVLLKDELRRHAMPRLDQDAYRTLCERVVHWAIEEYYGPR